MRAVFSFLITSSPVFSITLADVVLAVGIVVLIFRILKGLKIEYPQFFTLLLLYAFSSLISASLSLNPYISLPDTKELFILFLPPIILLCEKKWLKNGLVLGVSLAAFLGILREMVVPHQRLTGFVGHYMTEGGIMMIAFLFIAALILFEKFSLTYLFSMGVIFFALVLTLTRSAWVGTVFGIGLILYFKRKWAPLLLIPIILIILILAPGKIKQRAVSIFSLTNPTNVERINMWKIGMRMFRDHPLFGVGQNMVSDVYPAYNKEKVPPEELPHLHNNILQIAVERGIISLIIFLAFISFALLELLKIKEGDKLTPEAIGAIAVILGFFIAGLFEYNFGDSEVKFLFLSVITIPFVKDYKKYMEGNYGKNS